MEMHLQPLATNCFVSGETFVDGARVASYLVRATTLDIVRYDVLETHAGDFAPVGHVVCRWVQAFKPRRAGENADRALKLTAENLFVTLVDPNGTVRHVSAAHRDPRFAAEVERFGSMMIGGLGSGSAVLAVQRSGQPVRRAGETAELAVDTGALHFFDPGTGAGVYE